MFGCPRNRVNFTLPFGWGLPFAYCDLRRWARSSKSPSCPGHQQPPKLFHPVGTPPLVRSSASGSGGMGRRLGLAKWDLAAKFNPIGLEPIDAGGVSPAGERPGRRSRPAICVRGGQAHPPGPNPQAWPPSLLPVAPSGDDYDERLRQAASEFRTAHIIIPRTWNLLVFSPFRPDIGEHA